MESKRLKEEVSYSSVYKREQGLNLFLREFIITIYNMHNLHIFQIFEKPNIYEMILNEYYAERNQEHLI